MTQAQQYKAAVVQAAPGFLDLAASVDKTITLIEQAANQGASVVAFPEAWIPGYPWWIWLGSPAWGLKFVQAYHQNSLVKDSPEMDQIREAARANSIMVSLGASERDHGSLYLAQFLIGADGNLIHARRKLKPTHAERTVFGDGDGSSLEVHDTPLGRIGNLCCWEHLQPLTKYAMFSMHEQVHIGAWPSFTCYPQAYSLSAEMNMAVSSVYSLEGQCYFLAPTAVVSQGMLDVLIDSPDQQELFGGGGGSAMIYGPDGKPLCEPIDPQQEGMLIADIDLGAIAVAKSFADPVGHYSRPDVTRLLLNKKPAPPVQELYVPTAIAPDLEVLEEPELTESAIVVD
ncbi:carbon-nitrogen hydrolase family protein [Pseudomaricurvus alkylphenolicus]|uniref:carbon-nitrogen hydrolase family protein n=1 Tax=Pseudomaricurvus alkylphenolicus TaxID=1306991 RepID=UPI001422242E|nr:carbon-nitrogen hydrolase family protein [Pseudomaricurvus alkylphenolicus]NIB42822.1 carbon-nitrogen hydrolase family protein [Pseudomaricurvus alkylphenolicus]